MTQLRGYELVCWSLRGAGTPSLRSLCGHNTNMLSAFSCVEFAWTVQNGQWVECWYRSWNHAKARVPNCLEVVFVANTCLQLKECHLQARCGGSGLQSQAGGSRFKVSLTSIVRLSQKQANKRKRISFRNVLEAVKSFVLLNLNPSPW